MSKVRNEGNFCSWKIPALCAIPGIPGILNIIKKRFYTIVQVQHIRMIRFYPILLCLLSCSFVSAFVDPMAMPEVLTADDYDEKTAGKTIFVKFFSPK